MKQIITLVLFLFISLSGFSQTILKFFCSVPDSAVLNISAEERLELAEKLENQSKDASIIFDIFDPKNGYLRAVGLFEGHIDMCYWNLTNGNKLVAVYVETCGPVCGVETFYFYEYDGKNLKSIPKKDIIPDIYNDFLGENSEEKIKELDKEDIVATLVFELPRYGKNIIAKWGNEGNKRCYEKYAIGNTMKLIWNDGKKFKKSKIYWK